MDIEELKEIKNELREQHAEMVISDLMYFNECVNLYLGDKKSGRIDVTDYFNGYDEEDGYVSIIESEETDEYGEPILKYCTIKAISMYKKKNNIATLRFDVTINGTNYENVHEDKFFQIDYTEIGDYILSQLEKNILSKKDLIHKI